jgi:transcriptional regulator with XRE-family HTH domain
MARWSPSQADPDRRLDGELYRLRREGTLTQQQVARELKCSASKLIRIEGGHSPIPMAGLDALLNMYGVAAVEMSTGCTR